MAKRGDNIAAVKDCVMRVEACLDRMATLKADYMNECKELREEIKGVYDDARALGVVTQSVKTLVQIRILEARIGKAIDALDVDQYDSYQQYVDAVPSFSDTPLGRAARPTEEEVDAP